MGRLRFFSFLNPQGVIPLAIDAHLSQKYMIFRRSSILEAYIRETKCHYMHLKFNSIMKKFFFRAHFI